MEHVRDVVVTRSDTEGLRGRHPRVTKHGDDASVGERKGWGRTAAAVAGGLLAAGMLARLAQHTDARAAWTAASRARWLEARRHEAVATDRQVTRLRVARASTALASLPAVFAIEAGLSVVRSAVVVHAVGARPRGPRLRAARGGAGPLARVLSASERASR
jgi:hypothetical protein